MNSVHDDSGKIGLLSIISQPEILVIILCCYAEEELGPRGKNKWKNNKTKKPKVDGPEFAEVAGVAQTIHFKYPGQDFDVTEGQTFNNLTFLAKDSTGNFVPAGNLVDSSGNPFRLEIKAKALKPNPIDNYKRHFQKTRTYPLEEKL